MNSGFFLLFSILISAAFNDQLLASLNCQTAQSIISNVANGNFNFKVSAFPNARNKIPQIKSMDELVDKYAHHNIYTPEQNQNFIDLNSNHSPDTVFVETENIVKKDINDIQVLDKKKADALDNLHKEVQAQLLLNDPRFSRLKGALQASYSDFKGTKFAFSDYPEIKEDFKIWYRETTHLYENILLNDTSPELKKVIEGYLAKGSGHSQSLSRWYLAAGSSNGAESTNTTTKIARSGEIDEEGIINPVWFDEIADNINLKNLKNINSIQPTNPTEIAFKIEYHRFELEQSKILFDHNVLTKSPNGVTVLNDHLIDIMRKIKMPIGSSEADYLKELTKLINANFDLNLLPTDPILKNIKEFYSQSDRFTMVLLTKNRVQLPYDELPGTSFDLPGAGAANISAAQEAIALNFREFFNANSFPEILTQIENAPELSNAIAEGAINQVKSTTRTQVDEPMKLKKEAIENIMGPIFSSGDDILAQKPITTEQLQKIYQYGKGELQKLRIVSYNKAHLGDSNIVSRVEGLEKKLRKYFSSPKDSEILNHLNISFIMDELNTNGIQLKMILTGPDKTIEKLPKGFSEKFKEFVDEINKDPQLQKKFRAENIQLNQIIDNTSSLIEQHIQFDWTMAFNTHLSKTFHNLSWAN